MPEGACLCEGHGRQVARGSFRETGQHHGISDGFLHQGFVNMMATLFLRLHNDATWSGEYGSCTMSVPASPGLIRIGSVGIIESSSLTMSMRNQNKRDTFSADS